MINHVKMIGKIVNFYFPKKKGIVFCSLIDSKVFMTDMKLTCC